MRSRSGTWQGALPEAFIGSPEVKARTARLVSPGSCDAAEGGYESPRRKKNKKHGGAEMNPELRDWLMQLWGRWKDKGSKTAQNHVLNSFECKYTAIILNFHLYNAKNSAGQLFIGSFRHEFSHVFLVCITICISVENKSIDSGCKKVFLFKLFLLREASLSWLCCWLLQRTEKESPKFKIFPRKTKDGFHV